MGQWMDGFMEKLAGNRDQNLAGGGPDRIALQHERGKLTARERIDALVDDGTFMELGSVVRDPRTVAGEHQKPSPSDGVVMGSAEISGRQVMVYATDFTVMSGSLGEQGVWKIAELVQMAGQQQVPIIGIFDDFGSRISFTKGYQGLLVLSRLIRNY